MLGDQEESVRIAIKALTDMHNSGPHQFIILLLLSNILISNSLSGSRTPPTSSYISTSSQPRDPSIDTATTSLPAFVSHMSTFPLVGSALRVYEQGKASSRVVKSILLILILRLHVTLFPLITMW